MKKLEKELAAVNEYLFRMWAGRSIDKSSQPFNICRRSFTFWILVTNPLCCIASISDATNLHQYSLYSIPLPICTVDKTLTLNQTLVPLSVPYLSIEQGLRMIDYPISSFGRCLILRCESDERNYSIPPFFSLQSTSDNMKVVLYSIRTVVCREKDTMVVYKRLFHPMWKKSQSRRIYDVHSIGQWVRQEADSIQEVSWRQVQRLCPLAIHYEKIEHWIVCLIKTWRFLSSSKRSRTKDFVSLWLIFWLMPVWIWIWIIDIKYLDNYKVVRGILILDEEGNAIVKKYYTNDFPTAESQTAFEQQVFKKFKPGNSKEDSTVLISID